MPAEVKSEDLVIHILNVGHGDAIIIGFPHDKNRERTYGMVDCYQGSKVRQYLDKLYEGKQKQRLEFVCATHPHYDHVAGIRSFILDDEYCPWEFWDSGFRHGSNTYRDILVSVMERNRTHGTEMIRVSSGMEWYFGKVRISALSPSVVLRNKYVTYGVDMNNASIVLRIEHHEENVLVSRSKQYDTADKAVPEAERAESKSVIILAGDAEFEAWAQVTNEYPRLETGIWQGPMVKRMLNFLNCSILKISHHGSMHSAPLDIYEKMTPSYAIVSCEQTIEETKKGPHTLKRGYYPHPTTILALEECGSRILTTDGSYEKEKFPDSGDDHPGTIMIVIPPGKQPRLIKLDDKKDKPPAKIPTSI